VVLLGVDIMGLLNDTDEVIMILDDRCNELGRFYFYVPYVLLLGLKLKVCSLQGFLCNCETHRRRN